MPRYKVLKSVAYNFGHSFTSLMNYRSDDYVMGHLLRAARESGQPTLRVDILSAEATPRELLPPPVSDSVTDYCRNFPRFVSSQGSALSFIRSAVMEVTFDLDRRRPVRGQPKFEESPYTCRVEIIDDRGKSWIGELKDWWYPESGGVVDQGVARPRTTTVTRLGQIIRTVWRPK